MGKHEGAREFDSKKRYFYAVVIALAVFFFGFFISYGINAFSFQKVSVLQDNVFYNFYSTQLSHELFDNGSCNQSYYSELSQSLDFQGSVITQLEQEFGKKNKYVQDRKAYYTLLELSHYNQMKQMNERCGLNNSFILFFYSNNKKYVQESENVGKILSYLKVTNPSVLIYSFDSDSTDPLVKQLVAKYNVHSPILVEINSKYNLTSVKNIKDIEQYLQK